MEAMRAGRGRGTRLSGIRAPTALRLPPLLIALALLLLELVARCRVDEDAAASGRVEEGLREGELVDPARLDELRGLDGLGPVAGGEPAGRGDEGAARAGHRVLAAPLRDLLGEAGDDLGLLRGEVALLVGVVVDAEEELRQVETRRL